MIGLANKTRLILIQKIIYGWLKQDKRNKIKVYIDEAQETITPFIDHVYGPLTQDDKNRVHPILIDAHLDSILENKKYIKYFGDKIKHYENTQDLSKYIFMCSMPFIPMDWKTNNDILASYEKDNTLINKDDYILWIGPYKRSEQEKQSYDIINRVPDLVILLISP
jgi:hypothetical protein